MPTYEYACGACGHAWEQVQRITEAPIETCPKCAENAAHRLISGGTRFILKGGGWYSDLYSTPKSESKETDVKGDGSKEAKSETKSESKSDATSGSTSTSSASPSPSTPSTPSTPSSSS